jgi:hypothetical protein
MTTSTFKLSVALNCPGIVESVRQFTGENENYLKTCM